MPENHEKTLVLAMIRVSTCHSFVDPFGKN
jgi:hypothetical protein